MDSKGRNRVAEIRKQRMMSKAELARAAGISPLTIDRVERGLSCRMDTKRKIIRALGLDLSQAAEVFPEETEGEEAAEPAEPPAPPAPVAEKRPRKSELLTQTTNPGDIKAGTAGEGDVSGAS
jgi:DNA-binding XRE family transcriptional regulator